MFTYGQKLRAVQRELEMRREVYPRRIAMQKMTSKKANYELEIMEAIVEDYRKMEEAERLI